MTRLFVDFNNADVQGRIRLNSNGTLEDIKKHNLKLHDELRVQLYSDDDADAAGNQHELSVEGIVRYSAEEKCWVAAIDWSELRSVKLTQTLPEDRNGTTNGKLLGSLTVPGVTK